MTIVFGGPHNGMARSYEEEVIMRRVLVNNRKLTPEQLMEKFGRVQMVEQEALRQMPRGKGRYAMVHLFLIKHEVDDTGLEKEYEQRGMLPADPYSFLRVNRSDVYLPNPYPNGTHWQGTDGKWYAVACRFDGYFPLVFVGRINGTWPANCRFAGILKNRRR